MTDLKDFKELYHLKCNARLESVKHDFTLGIQGLEMNIAYEATHEQ
jgi:hypothetical protein